MHGRGELPPPRRLRPLSAMRRRAARGPGPPFPRAGVPPPPLLLLALAARGGYAAPAPHAEDLSLGVVSVRPGGGLPAARGRPPSGACGNPDALDPFRAGKLRLGRRLRILTRAHLDLGEARWVPPGLRAPEPAAVAGTLGGWRLTLWPKPCPRLRAAPKRPLRRMGQQSQPPRAGHPACVPSGEWRGWEGAPSPQRKGRSWVEWAPRKAGGFEFASLRMLRNKGTDPQPSTKHGPWPYFLFPSTPGRPALPCHPCPRPEPDEVSHSYLQARM